MACGRDTANIELYLHELNCSEQDVQLVATLKGHENWVQGLDFTTDGEFTRFTMSFLILFTFLLIRFAA